MGRRAWAWFAAVLGCLLLAPGALAVKQAVAATAIGGPLNLLLVGIDPRNDWTAPLADSIIVAHIPADRSGAYLFSVPRDLVVQIPAFAKSGSPTQRTKINAAMALGSRIGERRYDPAQGFELLAQAVGDVTGIRRFDAGAVLNFGGFRKLVDAIGGVSLPVDQDVVSEHLKPDGHGRDRLPECPGHDNCHRPYIGVQKTYPKSEQPVHFKGWEALDFCRQRYGLPHSDYDRQRHQRQFVAALAKKLKRTIIGDPAKLVQVTTALGSSLTFIGGGRGVAEWAQALKVLRIKDMTGVGLPGSALFEGGLYQGEQLPRTVGPFFTAVVQDSIPAYLRANPGVVTVDH
ncbi:LCP family protein [Actinoplanes sp. HUAS TT8]|uniref:LCP family protein n=1 Tax=Actinoplanes sp. HUAS TT8 TaxID=3447453 RepID=UPI003F5241AE